jgi:hypothetical protein
MSNPDISGLRWLAGFVNYNRTALHRRRYYICRDYLGSITHVVKVDGSLKAEYSYSAWSRLHNPATLPEYTPGSVACAFARRISKMYRNGRGLNIKKDES